MGLLDDWLPSSLARHGDPTRPSVTLSYAQSLDGSIALHRGEPLALSGPDSQKLTHQLRAAHEAILVGIGTVLSDDPRLNVRLVAGQNPQIVVLDSQLRLPLTASMLIDSKPHVFCVASASREAQRKLEQAGAVVERQSDPAAPQVELPKMLARLKQKGIRSLMVEGGGRVISSFLSENFVDRVVITVAPQYVGGYKALVLPLVVMPEIRNAQVKKFGKDYVIWGEVGRETR